MDRDPLFCRSFREMLKTSGVKPDAATVAQPET